MKERTAPGPSIEGGWKALKVVGAGSSFRCYLNGIKVRQGKKGCRATGRVGSGICRSSDSTGDDFRVDWSGLTIPEAAPG